MLTLRGQSAGSGGTLQRPLELPVDLSRVSPNPILRRLELGYSQGSSTAVYGFTVSRRVAFSLRRRSEDRLVVHVDVALLEAESRRRVAALTSAASGVSDSLVLPAGRYLIVASLLVPETVALELEVVITPVLTSLKGVGRGNGWAEAMTRPSSRAVAAGQAPAVAVAASPLMRGSSSGSSSGVLTETAVAEITGRLQAAVVGASELRGRLAPFHWIDAYGRQLGPLITIQPALWDRSPVDQQSDLLSLRLVDGGGAPLDLAGLNVVLEAWDSNRLRRYGLYSVNVVNAAEGRVDISLNADAVHTLPEESCWDLRVHSVASGETVYLLQGALRPLRRYTSIGSLLLAEDGGWLLLESQQVFALEAG